MPEDDAGFQTNYQGDKRPVPDPTALTTRASDHLEAMLRNLIKTEIAHQQELFDVKLVVVTTEFALLDARTAEQKSDTKAALDAALAAQKEAVASQTASSEKSIIKSETATIERIKAVETLLATSTKATDDKIDDIKARVIAIEAIRLGRITEGTETRALVAESRGSRDTNISTIALIVFPLVSVLLYLAAHYHG